MSYQFIPTVAQVGTKVFYISAESFYMTSASFKTSSPITITVVI